MQPNDYYVVIHTILTYLYDHLKNGQPLKKDDLMYNGNQLSISHDYWLYILANLDNDGFVYGLSNINVGNGYYVPDQLEDMIISQDGIRFLFEDPLMKEISKMKQDILQEE